MTEKRSRVDLIYFYFQHFKSQFSEVARDEPSPVCVENQDQSTFDEQILQAGDFFICIYFFNLIKIFLKNLTFS